MCRRRGRPGLQNAAFFLNPRIIKLKAVLYGLGSLATKRFWCNVVFVSCDHVKEHKIKNIEGVVKWVYSSWNIRMTRSHHPPELTPVLLCVDKRGRRWVSYSSRQQCKHSQNSNEFQCHWWAEQQKKRYNIDITSLADCRRPCHTNGRQAACHPRYYAHRVTYCAILAFPVTSSTIAQVQIREKVQKLNGTFGRSWRRELKRMELTDMTLKCGIRTDCWNESVTVLWFFSELKLCSTKQTLLVYAFSFCA